MIYCIILMVIFLIDFLFILMIIILLSIYNLYRMCMVVDNIVIILSLIVMFITLTRNYY
jgi:hypothetical protein